MIINIKDFGAIGDGKTVNTEIIQSAIDTCAKAGGGKVVIEDGTFVTGTLILRDNNLYIDVTATLKAAVNP